MIVPSACMGSLTVPISVQRFHTKEVVCAASVGIPPETLLMQHSPPCWNSLRAGSRTSYPPIGTGARDPHIWLSSPRISFVTLSYAPLGKLRRQDRDMRTPPRRFRGAQPNGDTSVCAWPSVDGPTLAAFSTISIPPFNWKAGPPRSLPPSEQGPRRSAWRADAAGF